MKWIHLIWAAIAVAALQRFQDYLAVTRLKSFETSWPLKGIEVCTHFVDSRASQITQRINIRKSPIHEYGLFANATIPCGSVIYDAYTQRPLRALENTFLEFSKWGVTNVLARVNHHPIPSARVAFQEETSTWVLYALRDIASGEEITNDYLDRPYFSAPPYPQWDSIDTHGVSDKNISYRSESTDISEYMDENKHGHESRLTSVEVIARIAVICFKWVVIPIVVLLL